MPQKTREAIRDLRRAEFIHLHTKGSHRKFYHPKANLTVIVSGGLGDDVPKYLEQQIKDYIQRSKQ